MRRALVLALVPIAFGCDPKPAPTPADGGPGATSSAAAAELAADPATALAQVGQRCLWRAKESFISRCPHDERQRFFERLGKEWKNDPSALVAMAEGLHSKEHKVARAAARMIHYAADLYISEGLSPDSPRRADFADKKVAERLLDALGKADSQTAADIVRGVVFVATAAGLAERTFQVLDGRDDPGGWPRRMGYRASLRFGGTAMLPQLDRLAKSGAKHDVQNALSATKEIGPHFSEADKKVICDWVRGYVDDPVGGLPAAQYVADSCSPEALAALLDKADTLFPDGILDPAWSDVAGRIAGRGAPHDKRALAMLDKLVDNTKLPKRTRVAALDSLRRYVRTAAAAAICKKAGNDADPLIKDTAALCITAAQATPGAASAAPSDASTEPAGSAPPPGMP